MNLCGNSKDDGVDFRRFGVTIKLKCSFDISQLVGPNVPQEANKFYELFLEDANGDLIDVPVLIENYIDEGGDTPNEGKATDTWEFSRRFFIYDTISGIEGQGEYFARTKNTTVL